MMPDLHPDWQKSKKYHIKFIPVSSTPSLFSSAGPAISVTLLIKKIFSFVSLPQGNYHVIPSQCPSCLFFLALPITKVFFTRGCWSVTTPGRKALRLFKVSY